MKNDSTFILFIKNLYFKSLQEIILPVKLTGKDFTGMEEAKYSPSAETIRTIMNFARTYDVMETESAGQVEMILN